MDRLTKEQRRKNMRAVKSKGSAIEVKLAKALWHKGIRYRKNDNTIFGKPDISLRGLKIAIFCDSEFWHGKDWEFRKNDHKSNIKFWHNKIEKNIKRDKEVNERLLKDGWKVLRFWGEDIEKKLDFCVMKIIQEIENRKNEKI
jgi:DNA mismatch endonuclease Vsr